MATRSRSRASWPIGQEKANRLAWHRYRQNSLDWACDSTTTGALSRENVVHLPLQIPQYYKDKPKELYSPVSRRWLYNIPRSKKTEGVRALGLLAFLDQTYNCYDLLGSSIATALARLHASQSQKRVDIYLIASSTVGRVALLSANSVFSVVV